MGGKTGTTTQSMQIPPEVMARYNAVNKRAEGVAQQPFQQYSSDPSAFVAQLNQQQQAGINNINQQANAAQPAYQAAMQGTGQAYQGFNAPNYQQGVQGYMSPFLSSAMGATAAQLQNINQQQQQAMKGSAIGQGAFGGDRANIGLSNLINQQNLATGQTLGQMAQQGYQSAAQNYMAGLGQQGQLAAQMGALGAGAQAAGLQGAQAQLGAGTLGQQTEQAGKTALYNQFLQQQAYPFQVAQFLANIAMGTGALSGSTTTTTQPMSFFSDRRLKEDIKRIGETDEGLPIYKFKYKGDPTEQTHVGFMADEVEKVHPEAVGHSHGYKTVDYDKATSEGGAVQQKHAGLGFADGGYAYNPYDPNSIQNIIARQQAMFATPESHYVPLARQISGGLGKHSRVPEATLPISQLRTPSQAPALPDSMLKQGLGAATDLTDIATKGRDLYKFYQDLQKKNPSGEDKASSNEASGGRIGYSLTGAVTNKEEDKYQTPEGLYSAEQTGKLNIPTEMKNYKLLQQSTLPGAMQDPTMRDIMAIASFASGFKSHGGPVGREHHDGSEGNVVGKKQFGPYKFEPTPEQAAGVDPDLIEALQRGSTAALPKGYYARFVSGHRDVNPQHPDSMHSVSGPARATDIEIVDPEGKALPNYQDPRFFKPYHDVAKSTLDYLEQKDPEMAKRFSWGGLFSGPPGKYGAMDTMHYSFDEPMAGGTIREGLNPDQASLFAGYTPAGKKVSSAAEPSMLDKLADMVGFTKANAQELKDKNLQGTDSTDLLLSILAGAGTMASSNSPFLGAAILQGIGGGAKTYAGLRGQALERGLAQQGIDITARTQGIQALKYLQDRYKPVPNADGTGIHHYIDMNGGEVSVDQYNQIMQQAASELGLLPSIVPQGGLGGVRGPAQSDAATESSGLGAAKTETQEPVEGASATQAATTSKDTTPAASTATVSIPKVGEVSADYLSNPAKIQEEIKSLRAHMAAAQLSPNLQAADLQAIERLQNLQQEIDKIAVRTDLKVYDPNFNQEIFVNGSDYLKIRAEAAKSGKTTVNYQGKEYSLAPDPKTAQMIEPWKNEIVGHNKILSVWPQEEQTLLDLAHIYQNWKAGRLANAASEFQGVLDALGIEQNITEKTTNAAFDAAWKTAARAALTNAQSSLKDAPATALPLSEAMAPTPDKNAAALWEIITDTVGYGRHTYNKADQFISQDVSPKNMSQFNLSYNKDPETKVVKFLKQAKKDIGLFKGMTEAEAKLVGAPSTSIESQDENAITLKPNTSAQKIMDTVQNTPKGKKIIVDQGYADKYLNGNNVLYGTKE